jgi:hypothetical protein
MKAKKALPNRSCRVWFTVIVLAAAVLLVTLPPASVCAETAAITHVSVDRQEDPCHPYYYSKDPITYTVEYTIADLMPDITYDMKIVVKPRFGRNCKKKPPRKGMRGTAKGLAYDVGEGSHVMTIDCRPNNPEKHYVIPKCAKDGWTEVKYILKLYNTDTDELVVKVTYVEEEQLFVADPASTVIDCSACHYSPHGASIIYCLSCHGALSAHTWHEGVLGCMCCHNVTP